MEYLNETKDTYVLGPSFFIRLHWVPSCISHYVLVLYENKYRHCLANF
jgi:hypothetical protein